jgi:hypothetical protein
MWTRVFLYAPSPEAQVPELMVRFHEAQGQAQYEFTVDDLPYVLQAVDEEDSERLCNLCEGGARVQPGTWCVLCGERFCASHVGPRMVRHQPARVHLCSGCCKKLKDDGKARPSHLDLPTPEAFWLSTTVGIPGTTRASVSVFHRGQCVLAQDLDLDNDTCRFELTSREMVNEAWTRNFYAVITTANGARFHLNFAPECQNEVVRAAVDSAPYKFAAHNFK